MTLRAPPPFVVFGLPRSRTLWLAHWLGGGEPVVGHDTLVDCDSPEDFLANFHRGMLGTVETAGVQGWRLMRDRMPEARFVTIRRPLGEVLESLRRVGACFAETPSELLLRDAMLDELEACDECQRYEFDELADQQIRRFLFAHLREQALNLEWDEKMARTNIQVVMVERLAKLAARQEASQALAAAVLSATRELPPWRKWQ